jgi:NADH:ubiquinone oxidoreductase subunit F (NADH-binding)
VANGCEGEPMSAKDRVLLRSVPHLVIDGALAVAGAISADEVLFATDECDVRSGDALHEALAERPDIPRAGIHHEIVWVPSGYVTGQESALVHWLDGGVAKPTAALPRVTERGLRGRPTLVSNVETLAHAGLIARRDHRPRREAERAEDPGTVLVTLSGAVRQPAVYEIGHGYPLASLLRDAGGVTGEVAAFLVGGYAGGWIDAADLAQIRLDRMQLRRWGARFGPGIVVALSANACPVAESVRVAQWLAQQSAGQCGPCMYGLPAIADALTDVCQGRARADAMHRITRWVGQVGGRGACAHPDGAVGFVASALRVFAEDFEDHARYGICDGCERPGVLQIPGGARVRA